MTLKFPLCVPVCVPVCGVVHMSAGAGRIQKKASDPLELELQAVVNCLMGLLRTKQLRTLNRSMQGQCGAINCSVISPQMLRFCTESLDSCTLLRIAVNLILG